MIRWAEVAQSCENLRFETLSRFLNEKGVANEFTAINCELQDFRAQLDLALKNYKHLRIGAPYGETVLQNFTHLPALMINLKSCDVLVNRDGAWWPENLLHEALQTALADGQPTLDLTSSILVVGTGASARAIVAAVLRLGFNRVNITARSPEKGQALVEDLRKSYFSVQFQFIPQANLNSLPGIHSVVINTTPIRDDNTLLEQLYYFNFLAPGGMLIDCNTFPIETNLAKEAHDVGASVITGYLLACYTDVLWAERFLNFPISTQEYSVYLRAAFEAKSRT